MLSRLTLQSGQKSKACFFFARNASAVISSETASAVAPPPNEERDLVNFPPLKRAIYPEPVRMAFIPEKYFQFLYPKTGVTGPYMLGFGTLIYLLSKEIYVCEHEFMGGLTYFAMIIFAVKKLGPRIASYLDDEQAAELKKFEDFKSDSITGVQDSIDHENDCQRRLGGQNVLFEAKRENIGLQLESVYRQRLQDAFTAVKQKLDYQLETTNVKSRMEQKHMVNWIVDNVRKSITPAQETAALKQCFANLKSISAKA